MNYTPSCIVDLLIISGRERYLGVVIRAETAGFLKWRAYNPGKTPSLFYQYEKITLR
jgi:hypothetical protein